MRPPDDFKFNIKAFRLLTGHQTPPNVFPPDIQQALPPLSGRKKNWYYADLPREIVDEIWLRFKAAVEPLKAACKLRAVHFQYLHSAMVFGAGIAITFAAYRLLNLIAVAAFWIAYILTRPFGASFGDLLSQPHANGGLGLGIVARAQSFLVSSSC